VDWVRLTQRNPVRIRLDADALKLPLKIGVTASGARAALTHPLKMLGPRFCLSLRSAIAASVALLIALGLQWPYPYWAAIMVMVIMSPSLSAGIRLFPVRLAGVATGAALGFLVVAFFGQDRMPFLVANSAILFIFGVGASSLCKLNLSAIRRSLLGPRSNRISRTSDHS
jgi:hypothetical protein